jgi:outer membrane murein-binding lipoprotein Lpp
MSEDELKALTTLITELGDGLRADVSKHVETMNAKYDSLEKKIDAKKKADEAGERDRGVDGTMAERVAADRARSDSVDPAAFAALSSSVAELKKKQSRPMPDLNAFADAQAKADAVMIANGERAEPPMAGEDLVAYNIRLARKMQPHSERWKGVELSIIAADSKAFNNVLAEIRSDALQAGRNAVGLPLFQHRKIVQESPGGHKITSFVGNGTIFKQMSRPVRHVSFIGTRTQAAHY